MEKRTTRVAWDVIIVGAGPAGLSAALILGRACRKVLVCDTGTPRSWAAKEMHAFLTRGGIAPAGFCRLARRDLRRYRNVGWCGGEVTRAAREPGGAFRVTIGKRRRARCRKLLIATGVFDQLPRIDGIEALYGSSVFQCPYCDGWEMRDAPVAVYGKRRRGFEMARAMTAWTRDIVLCTDGPSGYSRADRNHLQRNRIELIEERIARLEGRRGSLQAVVFRNGRAVPREALFFDTPAHAQSRLAESVGCRFARHGGVQCGKYEATSVPGVFVAGNIIRDVQLSIVAAAEGARAAFGVNRALTREDFDRRATGTWRIEHPPVQDEGMQRRRGTHG